MNYDYIQSLTSAPAWGITSALDDQYCWWLKHAFLKYFFIKVEFLFYLHNQNQLYTNANIQIKTKALKKSK